jgi:iron complex transport system substrate-binding protein
MIKSALFFLALIVAASSINVALSSDSINQSSTEQTIISRADANQTALKESDYPRTIVDSAGRAVTVDKPIDRIIILSPDAATAVMALGAQDKVVGIVDGIKNNGAMFPLLKKKVSVGKFDDPNIDIISAIVSKGAAGSDTLVICYDYPDKPYGAAGIGQKLASVENANVVGFHFSQEIMGEELRKLGTLIGAEDKAEDYLDWYSGKKDELRQEVKEATDGKALPKVYIELSSKGGESSLTTPGRTNPLNNIITQSGGYNIAGNLSKSTSTVKWDWVASKNPDVIICIQSKDFTGWDSSPSLDTVQLEAAINEISSRTGASSISAVKKHRIYMVPMDMLNGIKNIAGLTQMAKIIHPEMGLDPNEVYKEYFDLMGIKYPDGKAFIYPKIN